MNTSSDWTWFDFAFHSLLIWFLLVGIAVLGPRLIHSSIRSGMKNGWLHKDNLHPLFRDDSPIVILVIAILAVVGVFYAYFVHGIFYRYWDRVLNFIGG